VYVDSDDSLTDSANLAFDAVRNITLGDSSVIGGTIGRSNTVNLTGTASRAWIYGDSNTVTLATGEVKSMALGFDNAPTGSNSFAFGVNNSGAGINFGRNNTSGASGIGIGFGNSGTAIGIGTSNNVSGNSSTGLGSGNTVSSASNQAIGYQNTCTSTGTNSVAIGAFNQSTGSGMFATTMGIGCQASASSATAFGFGAQATASNAGIFGYAPNTFSVSNSTSNSLKVAYETTNLLLTSSAITANIKLAVPDVAYSNSWDGDLSVPTKNAIYDKIEAIPAYSLSTITYFGGL